MSPWFQSARFLLVEKRREAELNIAGRINPPDNDRHKTETVFMRP
jgi:hypothetical protein